MSETDSEASEHAVERTQVSPTTERRGEGPVWCVVANMRAARLYGPGGQEIMRGTRHFAPGARLYIRHVMGRMGDLPDLEVVGRHRATHRFVRMIVDAALLERWRADLVYSPEVIRLLSPYWDAMPESRHKAEDLAGELADICARASEPHEEQRTVES